MSYAGNGCKVPANLSDPHNTSMLPYVQAFPGVTTLVGSAGRTLRGGTRALGGRGPIEEGTSPSPGAAVAAALRNDAGPNTRSDRDK